MGKFFKYEKMQKRKQEKQSGIVMPVVEFYIVVFKVKWNNVLQDFLILCQKPKFNSIFQKLVSYLIPWDQAHWKIWTQVIPGPY